MALQGPIESVLSDISKHFVMQFVHCAVGYSAGQRGQVRGTADQQVEESSQAKQRNCYLFEQGQCTKKQ